MYLSIKTAVDNKTPQKSAFAAHFPRTDNFIDGGCSVRPLHIAETGRRLTCLKNINIIKNELDELQWRNEVADYIFIFSDSSVQRVVASMNFSAFFVFFYRRWYMIAI